MKKSKLRVWTGWDYVDRLVRGFFPKKIETGALGSGAYILYLTEEEITASQAALAISASIGGGGRPDEWVLEYAMEVIEKRLRAIKAEKLVHSANAKASDPKDSLR